ncbi:MAG: alanyl-tRNA editing protein [Acidobacteria bacterium]|nr:alanyl-tRNA editing protein [Acidobacteriota bacterium]
MTERLYYTDPACTEFDATVLACETVDGRLVAVLDRTAFYPTSGGQPNDVGVLGDAQVLDVVDRDDGSIGHVLSAPLGVGVGVQVHGSIDRARRVDHRQQHTGQHILSAAFDRLHKARTVGFHLGAEVSTLDLDKVLGAESIARAEAEANRVVWEDRPVTIRFASAEDAAAMPLRKEPARTGPLRLIEVEGFDLSACGGTHVARAGEVGIVAVRTSEKFRGGTRLEFVCGGRALREFRSLRDAVAGSQTFLSVAPLELPAAIERLQGDNKDQRRTIKDLQDRLAVHEASALVDRATPVGAARVVIEAIDGWDQAGLKAMAAAAASRPGVVAALLSTTDPALLVVAGAADVPLDAAAVLKAMLTTCGGKGGGKPDLAQGGGLTGGTTRLVGELRQLIEQAIRP